MTRRPFLGYDSHDHCSSPCERYAKLALTALEAGLTRSMAAYRDRLSRPAS